jgi:uncharacterized membrane protein YdbT with pleckstrin-like domain
MEMSFNGQRKGEKVYSIIRRHPLAMRRGFYIWIIVLVLGALPVLLFPPNPDLLWIFLGAFVVGLLAFFYSWISWYFTIYIITNERVRLVTQKGLFGKSVIELPLRKVQNISFAVPGINGELFKYGTIVLQTMVGDLIMKDIYKPEKTYNLIQDILHEIGGEEPDEE